MKKIIIALILGFTTFGYSQNCKYKINEVDEFSKNKILETKKEAFTMSGIGFGFSTNYSLKKINNDRYLKLYISSPKIFTLRQGDQIMLKTDSENTVSLVLMQTTIARSSYNDQLGSTTWYEDVLIPITDENYQRLLTENILKLRVYTADGYIDDDVKEKRAKKFKEILKCIE
ncbi:MAG TPA: hypothetical protein VF677_11870 [Flavobacterium sp.]|jgi:hypothetical protein